MVRELPTSRGVLNGLIKFLIENQRNNQLGIKSSGKYASNYNNVNVLIISSSNYFYTEQNNNYNQWIKLWFLNKFYLDLEGFSMRCHYYKECPQNLSFSVSRDGKKWNTIHSSNISISLTGEIFETKARMVKYFKWTFTGPSNYNRNYVAIKGLDIYGRYYLPNTANQGTIILFRILIFTWIVR